MSIALTGKDVHPVAVGSRTASLFRAFPDHLPAALHLDQVASQLGHLGSEQGHSASLAQQGPLVTLAHHLSLELQPTPRAPLPHLQALLHHLVSFSPPALLHLDLLTPVSE